MSNKPRGILGETARPRAVNIGHGNFLIADRIVCILESGSLPMKRLRERSLELNRLVDATAGRKTRSVVVLDSEHLVLSALAPQTLIDRLADIPQSQPLPQTMPLLSYQESELVS
jgi:extracellular matrix regulatory protein A